jgi:hypothetical protein
MLPIYSTYQARALYEQGRIWRMLSPMHASFWETRMGLVMVHRHMCNRTTTCRCVYTVGCNQRKMAGRTGV